MTNDHEDVWKANHAAICSLAFFSGNERISSGSGFKIGKFLLTNNHVIQVPKATSVKFTFVERDGFTPSLSWTITYAQLHHNYLQDGEPESSWDFAVLKPNEMRFQSLPSLRLNANHGCSMGATTTHFGFPFEQENLSIHVGCLSSRFSKAGVQYLQLDASVNNGNSGGPLINPLNNEVIGVITRKGTGLTKAFDELLLSFDQNIIALKGAQGMIGMAGVDPINALIVSQNQMKQAALEIRRSSNVGIGYAYELTRIDSALRALEAV